MESLAMLLVASPLPVVWHSKGLTTFHQTNERRSYKESNNAQRVVMWLVAPQGEHDAVGKPDRVIACGIKLDLALRLPSQSLGLSWISKENEPDRSTT